MLVYVHCAKYIPKKANWLPKMRTFSGFFSVDDVANIRFNKLIINLGIKHRRAMIEFGPGICLHSTPAFHIFLPPLRLSFVDSARYRGLNALRRCQLEMCLKCSPCRLTDMIPNFSKPYSSATASAFNSILFTFCVALAVNCCCMRIYAVVSVVTLSISQWQSRFVPCIELYSSEHRADACEWRTHTREKIHIYV